MAGYPRVVGGRYPGTGMHEDPAYVAGYIAGAGGGHVGAAAVDAAQRMMAAVQQPQPQVAVPANLAPQQLPWRPMVAPGIAPVGEGHVPMPMLAETYGGVWGGAAGAPAGTVITFSARPQKPFKPTRLLARGTKSGATAIGNLIGQTFVGTDLQQAELGFADLETLGAGTAFDTWISFSQAEPGVWIRIQATLTAFPTPPDFEAYTLTLIGHYLQ
jgi:hypothetical protein